MNFSKVMTYKLPHLISQLSSQTAPGVLLLIVISFLPLLCSILTILFQASAFFAIATFLYCFFVLIPRILFFQSCTNYLAYDLPCILEFSSQATLDYGLINYFPYVPLFYLYLKAFLKQLLVGSPYNIFEYPSSHWLNIIHSTSNTFLLLSVNNSLVKPLLVDFSKLHFTRTVLHSSIHMSSFSRVHKLLCTYPPFQITILFLNNSWWIFSKIMV